MLHINIYTTYMQIHILNKKIYKNKYYNTTYFSCDDNVIISKRIQYEFRIDNLLDKLHSFLIKHKSIIENILVYIS